MALTVLVTFYSRSGVAEQLATAAAVGAVQARAGIRLRRLPDADPAATLERLPDARETLTRMHKEYVAPREADVLAADALIVASPADIDAGSAEWSAYLDLLARLAAGGKLLGKVGAAIPNGKSSSSFAAALNRLGLVTVPEVAEIPDSDAVTRAVALGRRVVAAAEAVKKG